MKFWTHRTAAVCAAGIALTLLVVAIPSAQTASAQTAASLEDRARQISQQLDEMEERSLQYNEDFLNAQAELDKVSAQIASNQSLVAAAMEGYEQNKSQAASYARKAYMGQTGEFDVSLNLDDISQSNHRRVFLNAATGNRQSIIEDLVASKKDLDERQRVLSDAQSRADAKSREIKAAKDSFDKLMADQQALLDSVQGDLKNALERERVAAEQAREKQAEEEARQAAAAAQAARRPAAVEVTRAPAATSNPVPGTSRPGNAPQTTSAPKPVTVPAPVNPGPPSTGAARAVEVALAQQGDPYVWAASGPNSFDCSGLVIYAYAQAGRPGLPHSSRALRSMSRSLSADQLQPGDLVFGGSPVHHVGIYVGNGQMVHAPHSGTVVKVTSMYSTSKPVSFGRLP